MVKHLPPPGFNQSIKSIILKSYPHKTKAILPEVVLRSAPTQDKLRLIPAIRNKNIFLHILPLKV